MAIFNFRGELPIFVDGKEYKRREELTFDYSLEGFKIGERTSLSNYVELVPPKSFNSVKKIWLESLGNPTKLKFLQSLTFNGRINKKAYPYVILYVEWDDENGNKLDYYFIDDFVFTRLDYEYLYDLLLKYMIKEGYDWISYKDYMHKLIFDYLEDDSFWDVFTKESQEILVDRLLMKHPEIIYPADCVGYSHDALVEAVKTEVNALVMRGKLMDVDEATNDFIEKIESGFYRSQREEAHNLSQLLG